MEEALQDLRQLTATLNATAAGEIAQVQTTIEQRSSQLRQLAATLDTIARLKRRLGANP